MKKLTGFFAATVVCLALLASCGGKGSSKGFLGTWETEAYGAIFHVTFNEDGTAVLGIGEATEEGYVWESKDLGDGKTEVTYGKKSEEAEAIDDVMGTAVYDKKAKTLDINEDEYTYTKRKN